MAESKNKLLSELKIMQETDSKTPIGAQEIITLLNDKYGVEGVERRSIYKDMALLESAGFGIKRCTDKRKGWYMDKRLFQDYELKIMCDSVYDMKCITSRKTTDIVKNLMSLTSDRGRKRFLQLQLFAAKAKASDDSVGEFIELILEAIFSKKKVEFQYTERNELLKPVIRREGKVYKLNPYLLYRSADTYYLVGAHDNHEEPTSYRLDRVVNLNISDEEWVSPTDKLGQNAEEILRNYVERSVGNYAGNPVEIVLEYIPDSIKNNILYDFIGTEVNIQKIPGTDRVRATFTKNDSKTLINWLTSYCNMFEVIAPLEVRKEVITRLKSGLDFYNKGNENG